MRLRAMICCIFGHRDRHRYGFPPGNDECTRCWRRLFPDGSTRGAGRA